MIIHPRINDDDMVILAVDPGDEHVGVAYGCRYLVDRSDEDRDEPPLSGWYTKAPGWRVVDTAEMTPYDFAVWYEEQLWNGRLDIVTVEKWSLYETMARKLIGSEMMTSQLIGFLRIETRMFNEAAGVRRPWHAHSAVQWEQNPASIQQPTKAVLKRLGIRPVSPANPDHQRSAELHLWHTLIRHGLVEGVRGDR